MRKCAISIVALLLLIIPLFSAAASSQNEAKKEMPPGPRYKVGDIAPDFTLKDQNGKDVSLHDFRGKKNVALAFYVFAFSGG